MFFCMCTNTRVSWLTDHTHTCLNRKCSGTHGRSTVRTTCCLRAGAGSGSIMSCVFLVCSCFGQTWVFVTPHFTRQFPSMPLGPATVRTPSSCSLAVSHLDSLWFLKPSSASHRLCQGQLSPHRTGRSTCHLHLQACRSRGYRTVLCRAPWPHPQRSDVSATCCTCGFRNGQSLA